MTRQMTSKEYLEGIRRADTKSFEDHNMDFDLAISVENNECRKLRALEIIAETLISIDDRLRKIIIQYPEGDYKLKVVKY